MISLESDLTAYLEGDWRLGTYIIHQYLSRMKLISCSSLALLEFPENRGKIKISLFPGVIELNLGEISHSLEKYQAYRKCLHGAD